MIGLCNWQCLLVKGWKGTSWSFPRGKKNKDEEDHKCAIREVRSPIIIDCFGSSNLDFFYWIHITCHTCWHVVASLKQRLLRVCLACGCPMTFLFFGSAKRNYINIEKDFSWERRSRRKLHGVDLKEKLERLLHFLAQLPTRNNKDS